MSAMSTEDNVLLGQVRANSGGNCFLTDVGVAGSVNQTTLMGSGQVFFTPPNCLHASIEEQ